jgi:hypothetical protein
MSDSAKSEPVNEKVYQCSLYVGTGDAFCPTLCSSITGLVKGVQSITCTLNHIYSYTDVHGRVNDTLFRVEGLTGTVCGTETAYIIF